jgi:hypothetical protein
VNKRPCNVVIVSEISSILRSACLSNEFAQMKFLNSQHLHCTRIQYSNEVFRFSTFQIKSIGRESVVLGAVRRIVR